MYRDCSSESGFTLVEILLVVFILGLTASVVVMNIPQGRSAFEEDAARLQNDVYELGERAVLTGIPHAIEFSVSDYQSLLWQGDAWVPLAGFGRALSQESSLIFPDAKPRDDVAIIVFDPAGIPSENRILLSGDRQQIAIKLSRNEVVTRR